LPSALKRFCGQNGSTGCVEPLNHRAFQVFSKTKTGSATNWLKGSSFLRTYKGVLSASPRAPLLSFTNLLDSQKRPVFAFSGFSFGRGNWGRPLLRLEHPVFPRL